MQKAQKNIQRTKKKNTETGMLVGQNTNLFSQLSANYLQSKNELTQEEDQFVKSTQIIQYHDQNINRILGLLRKKADVTKGKAAVELKQQVLKMSPQGIEELMPIFAQLFLEIILNEQSKQVIDQFSAMLTYMLTEHKKTVLKEVKTVFGPILINAKLNSQFKPLNLLFKGTQRQQQEKVLVLLMNKQVNKKFLIMCRIILQNEQLQKMGQPHFQRNCAALMRVLKDMIRIKSNKVEQQKGEDTQWYQFIQNIGELLSGKSIDQYMNNGGKAKAAILEVYSKLLDLYALDSNYRVDWKNYAAVIAQNYLDKDLVVQQSLWKACNKNYILSLKAIAIRQQIKDPYFLLNKNIPKIQEKFFHALKIGGAALYKSLRSYVEVFPECIFQQTDQHKQTVNKINFLRKIFTSLLELQDQNQVRIECYYQLANYFIPMLSKLTVSQQEAATNKKAKQINSLATKAQKEMLENLQQKFYSQPPASKNSVSYYIPQYFTKLIERHLLQQNIKFQFKFNRQHTFALYKGLKIQNQASIKMFELIFQKCGGDEDLQLQYLLNFPKRDIKVDLSENNKSIEKTAKIFLLSEQAQTRKWFQENWDQKKAIIIYDPRITEKQLNDFVSSEGENLNINYSLPKNLPSKLFDNPQFDKIRFQFFLRCLKDPDYIQSIKFLLPFVIDFLILRNPQQVLRTLLELFSESTQKLSQNKWIVSLQQVTKLRIISKIIFQSMRKGDLMQKIKDLKGLMNNFFEHFAQFCRRIYNYRMETQVNDMLQTATNCLVVNQMNELIVKSIHNSLVKGLEDITKVISKEQKTRRVRLTKFVQFLEKAFWHLIPMNKVNDYMCLMQQIMRGQNWRTASSRPDVWVIGQSVLNRLNIKAYQALANILLEDKDKYAHSLGLIMCSQIILPLQVHPEARTLFTRLQQFVIKNVLERNPESQLAIVKVLVDASLRQIEDAYTTSFGIRNIIKNLMKKYSALDSQTLNAYLLCCLQWPLKMIQENKNCPLKCSQIYSAIQNLITELPLPEIARSTETYQQIQKSCLEQAQKGYPFLVNCGILSMFWQKNIGIEFFGSQNMPNTIVLVKKIFATVKQCLKNNYSEQTNFSKSILFSFLTRSLTFSGIGLFKPFQKQIIDIFRQKINFNSVIHGITQAKRMKFASRFFNQFGQQFVTFIIRQIPEECLEEYENYKQVIEHMQAEQQNEGQSTTLKQQHILNMFIEFSEVFIRTGTTVLKKECCPDQTVLLKLLDCPFAGLKKTIFILLKQMYEQKVVKREPPTLFKSLLCQNFNLNVEQIDPLLAASLSSYFYTWQSVMLRRQAIQRPLNSQEEQTMNLQEYISQENMHQTYLKTSFEIFQTHLQYLKNQAEFVIQTDQLLSDDLVSITVDQSSHSMQQKLFKLIIKSLFNFVLNFPLFLRDFIDRNKKYRNICERLLRTIISDGIFNQEIKRVEIRQPEWKAEGNFEIYVNTKNRQIYAEYTRDLIRIGLRIAMKASYPLMPLTIEFGDGLKLQQGGRWQLMLQTQLHNRNNTIINGILLWKDNIDKKLSGVEECAICYDIVNAAGQLPKKACKTCKKKFHGNCIMKWFSKSNKSECPLCKSQFL